MRVAHLLPRQRGNVAGDNHTFVNALLWMCRTGVPWRGLPERCGKWGTSASGSTAGPGTARQGACSRHCRRSGSSGWGSGCPPWTPRA
ncbi:transposase [Bifidobacterium longum]|uniref:transposase n=1 Tax=Bifidobacterium longum TaxID=216816 RepID=UPI003C6CA628